MSERTAAEHAHAKSLAWARAATLFAVTAAVLLAGLKLFACLMTGSAAVLGSLADSGLDLFGSLVAAGAVRYAALPPDDNHRFGHQKAEALTSLAQVVLITASASLVAWESAHRLFEPEPIQRPAYAITVLALSTIVTIGLVSFQTIAMKRSGSLIVEGDRAHYLGDVIANSGALIAVIISAYFAFPLADPIAGLIAALFLAIAGWRVARKAIPQLMDEELPESERGVIQDILNDDPDVIGFHALRTRRAGGTRFIQIDIELDPDLSLRHAHKISDRIEHALERAIPDVDVIIHFSPA
jgi:ferrous-iron efflux pump FieF